MNKYVNLVLGIAILVATLVWVFAPDFIPGPIDDIIVAIVGATTSTANLTTFGKKKVAGK